MRLREARTENTLAFSEASRSVWLQRGQKWASCSLAALALPSLHALHAATHRLTDHPSVRRQCLAFLRQPELSAPVGGRAPGLRSEGSWLAAELLCAGLEPGVLDRCAGWVGLSPAQPTPGHFPPRGPVCLCVFVCGLVNSHDNKRVPAAQTPRRGTSRLDSRARVHPPALASAALAVSAVARVPREQAEG